MAGKITIERSIAERVEDIVDIWINGDTPVTEQKDFLRREWQKFETTLDFSQREEYKRRFETRFNNTINQYKKG